MRMGRLSRAWVSLSLGGCLAIVPLAWQAPTLMAQSEQSELTSDSARTERVEEVAAKAIEFLKVRGQLEDGSFSATQGPGVTALVLTAVLRNGVDADVPFVKKGLAYLEDLIHDDGGIYSEDSRVKNYETCLSIMAFAEANGDGRYTEVIERAKAFVVGEQYDEAEGKTPEDPFYGGTGYGSKGRPDLSNTSVLIEALIAAGEDADSEAIQRALYFVSRAQNLESEHNTLPFPQLNPDGGFYYTPANGGESQAGTLDNGGLRSYASMTYAGLKSMIYAGVDKDDQRVQAAVEWLEKNYDLESNPGMGTAGLYYYYHTVAKSLSAYDEPTFTDEAGTAHYWRAELLAELAGRQQDDGSWVNSENPRWMEDNPSLVTAYALIALSYCR